MDQRETTQDWEWVKLRNQLRDNERIWSGFREIEVRMIGSNSLTDLARVITEGIPETFSGIDCVTIACVDPEYEMTRLIDAGIESGLKPNCFVAIPRKTLNEMFAHPWRPRLGRRMRTFIPCFFRIIPARQDRWRLRRLFAAAN